MIESMLISVLFAYVIWVVCGLLEAIFDWDGSRAFHNNRIDNMVGRAKKEKKHGWRA